METQATQQQEATPTPIASHASVATPGDIVSPLDSHTDLEHLAGKLAEHMAHQVPDPEKRGEWVTRPRFTLFVEHPQTITADRPTVVVPVVGTDDDGEQAWHPQVAAALKRLGLEAKVVALTGEGATVEFTPMQGGTRPRGLFGRK